MLDPLFVGAVLAGTAIGCGTGLIPGVHPNTLAALLVAVPGLGTEAGVGLLVAAAVAHTFLNVVPALVLGVTDPELALATLPGHALVRKGEGQDALLYAASGSLIGLLAAIAVTPFLPLLAGLSGPVPYADAVLVLLLAVATYLVLDERGAVPVHRRLVPVLDGVVDPGGTPVGLGKVSDPDLQVRGTVRDRRRDGFTLETDDGPVVVEDVEGWADDPDPGDRVEVHGKMAWRPGPGSRPAAALVALVVFLGSGALGLLAQRIPLAGLTGPQGPLLPLLTGLFGGGTLLLARGDVDVPAQLPGVGPRTDEAAASAWPGIVAGGLVAALPGVTAAQGTAFVTLGRVRQPKRLLVALSAVNTAAAVLSLVVLLAFERVRSGVAHALDVLPATPAPGVLLAIALLAGAVAYVVTTRAASAVVDRAPTLASGQATRVVLVGIAVIVLALTGPFGLVLFGVATLVGTIPPRLGVRRVHLTGVLVVPLVVSFAGL